MCKMPSRFRISGPWFNIKMTSYPYRKSHCGDERILRPSDLHNGISYTVRWHLYTESGPWTWQENLSITWHFTKRNSPQHSIHFCGSDIIGTGAGISNYMYSLMGCNFSAMPNFNGVFFIKLGHGWATASCISFIIVTRSMEKPLPGIGS